MRGLLRAMLARWRHRRGTERYLHELDARTLKDIGVEPWSSALGAQVALRRQERRRWGAWIQS